MVHRRFAVAMLAVAVGGCAQMPEEASAPEDQQQLQNEEAPAAPPERLQLVEKPLPPVDIWDRLRRGLSLDRRTEQPKVKDYITYFSHNKGYMARVTERSRRYIFHVVEQLEEANLPLELALLPIVESAYDPFAYSHARASGMWQFIPATGRHYGLNQNWWSDGRRGVDQSTRAAIRHFTYLSQEFNGDWELALAAYNAGEGKVRRAVERNRRQGLGTSFWDLKLPRETQRYVPQLLALAEVVSRPDHYGVPLHDIANSPYYTSVDVGSQIGLARAAELADIEVEELYLLNPEYNRWATDPDGDHHLLIPVDKRELFETALAQLPEGQRVSWQRYKIARGDTLSTIARRYETSVAAIRQANKLRSNNIRAGKTLLIPQRLRPYVSVCLCPGPARRAPRPVLRQWAQEPPYSAPRRHPVGDIPLNRRYRAAVGELEQYGSRRHPAPRPQTGGLRRWQRQRPHHPQAFLQGAQRRLPVPDRQ